MLNKDELAELIEEYMKTVPMGPSGIDDRPWNSADMAAHLLPRMNREGGGIFDRIEKISKVIDWEEDIGEMREMKESDYQTLKTELGCV